MLEFRGDGASLGNVAAATDHAKIYFAVLLWVHVYLRFTNLPRLRLHQQ